MNKKQVPMNGIGPGATKGARALATERSIRMAKQAKRK